MEDPKNQKTYTGNFILTSDGFILIGFFIFSCFMFFKGINENNNKYLGGVFVLLVFFPIFTYKMNYFILTEKKLIVKNPIWIWKKIEFDLNSIKDISIVYPMKSPICLKIKTENSTKLIAATSLRNKAWKELKRDLENRNIIVNDKVNWD